MLIAVLGVWSTIAYKFIRSLDPDTPEVILQNTNVLFKPKTNTKVDTFSIQKMERDPFLGTLASNKTKTIKSITKKPKPKNPVNAPKVTYGGMVKKQKSSNPIFVLNINSKQYLLKQGQQADSVKLIRGNTKEVQIYYNNKTQTIKRH